MSRQTKIILGIIAGILVLCLIACVAGVLLFNVATRSVVDNASQDPAEVDAAATNIVEFDLPAGFQPESSFHLLGVNMAMYSNPSNDNFLILTELPMAASEDMVQQMQDAFEQNLGRNFSGMQVVEQRELTVRGQPATMTVLEGTDNDSGEQVRQMMVAFEGNNGTAMISVFGPVDNFDMAAYEQMIESIR